MADQKNTPTLWGIPVVVVDTMPADTLRLVAGDPCPAFDEMAREAIDRAHEPHAFEGCELDGWCAGLCHHGACLKTEAEHDG